VQTLLPEICGVGPAACLGMTVPAPAEPFGQLLAARQMLRPLLLLGRRDEGSTR
jgi:hypothetical protein